MIHRDGRQQPVSGYEFSNLLLLRKENSIANHDRWTNVESSWSER
jgi:hypothetical protein